MGSQRKRKQEEQKTKYPWNPRVLFDIKLMCVRVCLTFISFFKKCGWICTGFTRNTTTNTNSYSHTQTTKTLVYSHEGEFLW